MDFTGGLAKEISELPADLQPILAKVLDRVAEIEAQSARDVNAIADRVLAELKPMVQSAVDSVNTLTLTAATSVDLAVNLLRRVDGAKITIELGPLV